MSEVALMFDEPVLVQRGRTHLGRGTMDNRLYAERSSKTDTKHIEWELTMCKAIGRILSSHYPGHPWSVEVMADQGIAKIGIPPLLGPNWGYILYLSMIEASPKPVIEAGGHILERYRIPRSTIDIAAYVAAEKNNPLMGFYRARQSKLIPA